MKNNLTELVFILDRSGSMQGLESDTIGGYNSMLVKHRAMEGEALVTTVLFSDDYTLLHNRVPLPEVKELTDREYTVGGCTALLDAIGRTLDKIANAQRNMAEEELPGKTVFVITTDGLENASREYSISRIRENVLYRQAKHNWDFLYLGADIDAIASAEDIGIHASHAARYVHDAAGTRNTFRALSDALEQMRCCAPLDESWKASIEKDYRHRGKP